MQPDNQPNQPPDAKSADSSVSTPPGRLPVASDAKKPKKNKRKLFLTSTAVAVLLLGGSAAAYFGVYVPNQPENVLKTALKNTANEKQAKFNGKLNAESTDTESPFAATVNFNGQADSNTGNVQSTLDVTVSGVKVTLDVMLVDKSVYVKVGDLSAISGLAALAAPGTEEIIKAANSKIADQWIEIDQTLLKTAKADCAVGLSKMTLTDQDVQLLENRYKQVQFATIDSTSNEKVDGKASIKYEMTLDDNKLAEYGKELNDLSVVKKIKECDEGNKTADTAKDLADGDKTPLTLWVDKASKRIIKIASKTTKQDEDKSKVKGDVEVNLDYVPVQITKPENSRPLMEIVGELGSLNQGLTGGQLPAATSMQ